MHGISKANKSVRVLHKSAETCHVGGGGGGGGGGEKQHNGSIGDLRLPPYYSWLPKAQHWLLALCNQATSLL